MKRQCECQVGVRPTTIYNAVTVPRAVICPHDATGPDPRWCDRHQYMTAVCERLNEERNK